ncbi:putative small lipoprotein YifL [Aquamicrobium lusatiense]|uniref:Putative small lipoprotein YifL n=1 Tax=Aquamicrobium lusatiense TaxID=89772 RepID=A0A7W9VUR8_9HYPH|nr:lipoprotein [Aquamicrobium lusatiense]MBB6011460.1 putative small lipoprotein YifL [Aquamicrobium lusatiense]
MTAGRLVTMLALVATMATVSACGRKSGLDTPYEAAVEARKEAQRNKEPLPPEPQKPDNDKPFILDKLI